MNDFIGITDNRLLHMRGVAHRAYEISRNVFCWSEDKCRSMFVLGFIHDIGYEYSKNQTDHEHIGGDILYQSEYAYWREIYEHGNPDTNYDTEELFVLNLADMQIDSAGRRVTVEERLSDIATRYGDTSTQYTQAQKMVDRLCNFCAERRIVFPA